MYTNDDSFKLQIPYIKIFFIGVLLGLVINILHGLLFYLGVNFLLVAQVLTGGIFVAAYPALTYLLTVPLSKSLLRKVYYQPSKSYIYLALFMQYSFYSVTSALAGSWLFTLASGAKLSPLESIFTNPIGSAFIYSISAGLTFLFTIWLLNFQNLLKKITIVLVILVCLVSISYSLLKINKGDSIDLSLYSAGSSSNSDWAFVPTYLPTGVEGLNSSPCGVGIQSNHFYCNFYFKKFPGYLNADSQSIIVAARAKNEETGEDQYYQPTPIIGATIMKDDSVLQKYKYSHGKCNISGLIEVGTASLSYRNDIIKKTDKTAKDKGFDKSSCNYIKTPGGVKLFYEEPVSVGSTNYKTLNIPVRYYFEKSNAVIQIDINQGGPVIDYAGKVFFTDPNFQTEFYKFIESF